jgi:trigger factor
VDREAARGDLVQVKLRAGQETSDEPQDLAFEVGDERVWEELSLAVSGQKAGREASFERKNPQAPEEPATPYKLTIVNIQTRELPELDDAFAASVGEFESLAALKENVQARIRDNKTQRLRQEREQALMDELCARHPLDLPPGVVEEEQRRMLDAFAQDLARQGVDLDEANINWEEMAEKLKPRAEKQVHAGLVLEAVAEKESIAIPEERLESVLGQIAAAEKTSAAALRRRMDEDGRLIALRKELLKQETLRHLLGETGDEQDD